MNANVEVFPFLCSAFLLMASFKCFERTSPALPSPRDVLTPDALGLVQAVADHGSFAAAARELGLVPSAVTYRIRQLEDALDVLLFDRSSRQARLTAAGNELLCAGQQLLQDIDAMANRVKRVATGWEAECTVAVDTALSWSTVMELAEGFYALQPTTRLRLRHEALAGTLDALTSGRADLAVGVVLEPGTTAGVQSHELGTLPFVYCVAPHHPLAAADQPIPDEVVVRHRAVAVSDTTLQRGQAMTVSLLAGQDVLTVPSMRAKLDAQLRGLGGGFLPEPMARPYLESGRLVRRELQRASRRNVRLSYAWRSAGPMGPGRALQWWLAQLESAATRAALLERHRLA
jgi:DNA-binding transcriptional LysR family regulator